REPHYGGPLMLIDTKALPRQGGTPPHPPRVDLTPQNPGAPPPPAPMPPPELPEARSPPARPLILDEPPPRPTLTPAPRPVKVIADLKTHGVSVIFISHRLNEVESCADRVVVLRDGRVVGELDRREIRHDRMIRLMIGRDLKSLYIPPAALPGAPTLEIEGLR